MKMINSFYGRWAFLSNFYPSPLLWRGIIYPTAEHAYNAGKSTHRVDRYIVAEAPTPQKAKQLGRGLNLRPDWEWARYEVMREVLWAKFTLNPARIEALLATGDAVLVEGQSVGNRWHDQHWGDCYCGRAKCLPPGANHLGFMLMALRHELRKMPNGNPHQLRKQPNGNKNTCPCMHCAPFLDEPHGNGCSGYHCKGTCISPY